MTTHPTPWTVAEIRALGGVEYGVKDATGSVIRYLGNIPKDLAGELVAHANERAELREALDDMLDRTTAEGMVSE